MSYTFTYTLNGNNATITGLTEGNTYVGSITIPNTINSYTVTSIGDSAFYDYNNLTSVIISENITQINSNAFGNCTALIDATFNGNVPSLLGNNIFYNSASFKIKYYSGKTGWTTPSMTLGDTTYNTQKLYTVLNSPTPNHIDGYSSVNPFNLTLINSNTSGTIEYTIDGVLMFTSTYTSGSNIFIYKSCQVIATVKPTDVDHVASNSITLNFTVTKPMTIPDPIIDIPNSSSIYVNSHISATFAQIDGAISTKLYYAISRTNPTLDSNSSYTTNMPFIITANLLGGSSGSIIYMKFKVVTQLSNGTISSNIVSRQYTVKNPTVDYTLAYSADYPIAGEATITGLVEGTSYNGQGIISIPSTINGYTVTMINNNAFQNYTGIKSIIMSDTVKSIGNMAFYGSGITTISFSNALTTIGSSAFEGCGITTPLTLPSTLTSIDANAFNSCTVPYTIFNGNAPTFGSNSYYLANQYGDIIL